MSWRYCNVTQSNGHLVYSYVGGPVLVQFALTTAQINNKKVHNASQNSMCYSYSK